MRTRSVGKSLQQAEEVVSEAPTEEIQQGGPVLSTGSTLLNLACSGRVSGGFLPGKFVLLVGDASAGKTFLGMTCLAEACQNVEFAKHRLIYDNIEDGCLLDIRTLFNEDLERRLEAPDTDKGEPKYSSTIEEFYFHVDDALKDGRPFIYILDSMDALTSAEEDSGFEKRKKATRANQETSGSYGVSKARRNSEGLRRVLKGLRSTSSILIILCQTRADLGPGYAQKTRAGGLALRFYATLEIWASVKGTIKKNIRGKPRPVGVTVLWKVKKNRVIGALHSVAFDIYPSYGIDDIGSCVDYLVSEGHWGSAGQKINAEDIGLCSSREKLILQIEEGGLADHVRQLVGWCWGQIEADGKLKRQSRYRLPGDGS
jgi:RecA/RadA recombinase